MAVVVVPGGGCKQRAAPRGLAGAEAEALPGLALLCGTWRHQESGDARAQLLGAHVSGHGGG